jgi:hypothetical protein
VSASFPHPPVGPHAPNDCGITFNQRLANRRFDNSDRGPHLSVCWHFPNIPDGPDQCPVLKAKPDAAKRCHHVAGGPFDVDLDAGPRSRPPLEGD